MWCVNVISISISVIRFSYCLVDLNVFDIMVSGVFLLVKLMMVVSSMLIRFLFMIRLEVIRMLCWCGLLV